MAVITTRCLFIYVVLFGSYHRLCYAHAVAVVFIIFLAAMAQSTCTAVSCDQRFATQQGRSTASSEKKGNVRFAKCPETLQMQMQEKMPLPALGVSPFFVSCRGYFQLRVQVYNETQPTYIDTTLFTRSSGI